MNFSAWSIRNPVAPLLAFFLLTVLGIKSFYDLPITRFPNIDVPIVSVSVSQAGAAPAELEMQVTREVEDAVAGIAGVDFIQSTVNDGVSTTAIMFKIEVPSDKALQDVKDAIDRIQSDLPATAETPEVTKIDVESNAIQTFAISSPNMTLEELSWFVDDTVKRALQGKPGVGRIDRFGGADREVHIELDPAKLNSYGITAADVNRQVRNTNADMGSGRSQLAGAEQAIRTLGDQRDVKALANTTIYVSANRFVKLADLGTITDTYKEPTSFSRFNGNPVVSFAVFRSKGASEVTVAETVAAGLKTIREKNPEVNIQLVDDAVYFTYGNYESAIHTLIEGALLAVIVVFLFLRNWRATLISAVALPLSAIPTFWIMDMIGFSLNLVSFLAMTLATGILVDDAIVEIENIARHIKMGKSPYRAAIEAADEIGLAVIATSFTIIAVFAPVSFMGGIPGQYFIQFGLTVAISVFFSLAVARLITPLMAAYLMRASDANLDHGSHGKEGWIMRGYTALIGAVTHRWYGRYGTLVVSLGVLFGSFVLLASVPGSFMPPEDAGRVILSVELPPSAKLEDTDALTKVVGDRIKDIEGVDSIYILGGSSPKGDLELRRASIYVNLDKIEHSLLKKIVNDVFGKLPVVGAYIPKMEIHGRTVPQWDIETEIFKRVTDIPDARILKLNDRGERDVAYNLTSSNAKDLDAAAARLEADLRKQKELLNVGVEGALPRSEIQIRPDPVRMARLGITTAQVSELVRVATIGDIDQALSKVSLDDRMIPVRVQLNLTVRRSLAEIKALKIPTNTGASVPLASVADVNYSEGPSMIKRYDRNRVVTLGASLPPGVALDQAMAAFNKSVKDVKLPPTVQQLESGDTKIQGEMIQGFVTAMILGIMLVFAVLILLFKDVLQPITIIFSLFLATGGVAIALIITNNAMSMPVMIGMLMLMGIVAKNAILLVDFAVEMMHRGMKRSEAMVEAGRKRARPIIMTSIAMSAGMLPSALGVGEGGAFRAPMAIAVMGGILVSTVLSLVVVPAFFLIMDDLSRLLGWIFGRFFGKKDEEMEVLENEDLTRLLNENSRTISSLEERLQRIESDRPDTETTPAAAKSRRDFAANDRESKPLAAE
ncbi:efflux RND transporter permease subunit [Rhizobium sp. TH2]|uniref:efflux RND transporter permease subunit n=1 Tax=Rhizobium sp. TH2 TaxID=2775403 RepID=UPI0021587AA0|nr:efflux RND transporter permease subunit [Rhizobium sp. TH2]UVC07621.1 efflux RND transporter permease subunit [Rhizobium sp. TH2]